MAESLAQKHEINSTIVSELEKAFVFRNRGNVFDFIGSNMFLVPILFEAHSKIEHYFSGSELILESSPETEILAPGEDSLTIFINTPLKAKEAVKKLDQLDEEWWGDVLTSTKGKLSINLEFR